MEKYNWFNIQTEYLTIYKQKLRKQCFLNQQNIIRLSHRSSAIYSQRGIYIKNSSVNLSPIQITTSQRIQNETEIQLNFKSDDYKRINLYEENIMNRQDGIQLTKRQTIWGKSRIFYYLKNAPA